MNEHLASRCLATLRQQEEQILVNILKDLKRIMLLRNDTNKLNSNDTLDAKQNIWYVLPGKGGYFQTTGTVS